MKNITIDNKTLDISSWKAERYVGTSSSGISKFAYPLVPIGNVVSIRKQPYKPGSGAPGEAVYLGLEHIEGGTGELTPVPPLPLDEVRSTSKWFRANDILYARLRPNLNKVYLADCEVLEGVCSNEFLVLTATDKVEPIYLRGIISSSIVLEEISALISGATLPRVNAADFLAIKIPLPPLSEQRKIVKYLNQNRKEYRKAVRATTELPAEAHRHLLSALKSS